METTTTTSTFADLPSYAKLRAVGQMTIQAGMFMVALSSVLRYLGTEPPVSSTSYAETTSQQPNNTRGGYFD